MAAEPACGGLTARVVSAGTGGVHGAIDPPSPRQPGADGVESRATHAKGSGSDEPGTPPRDQRITGMTGIRCLSDEWQSRLGSETLRG
jgi:hypothetical protein